LAVSGSEEVPDTGDPLALSRCETDVELEISGGRAQVEVEAEVEGDDEDDQDEVAVPVGDAVEVELGEADVVEADLELDEVVGETGGPGEAEEESARRPTAPEGSGGVGAAECARESRLAA
jgi:hypothetical protein